MTKQLRAVKSNKEYLITLIKRFSVNSKSEVLEVIRWEGLKHKPQFEDKDDIYAD